MIDLIHKVGPELGVVAACAALGLARATYYRQLEPPMIRSADHHGRQAHRGMHPPWCHLK